MRTDHLESLRQYLHTLAALSDSAWMELTRIFHIRELEKDDFFARREESRKKAAFVVQGVFRKFILSEHGYETVLSFKLPGMLMCSSMETEDHPLCHIQALEEALLIEADYRDFKRLAEQFSDIDELHRQYLFQVIKDKETRENILLSSTGKDRYLLFRKQYSALMDKIPHYNIASYLGITPTQLSRIRKSLR